MQKHLTQNQWDKITEAQRIIINLDNELNEIISHECRYNNVDWYSHPLAKTEDWLYSIYKELKNYPL